MDQMDFESWETFNSSAMKSSGWSFQGAEEFSAPGESAPGALPKELSWPTSLNLQGLPSGSSAAYQEAQPLGEKVTAASAKTKGPDYETVFTNSKAGMDGVDKE